MSFNCRIHGWHHIQSGCPICYQMSMQSGSASTPLYNHYPVVTHDACQSEIERLTAENARLKEELELSQGSYRVLAKTEQTLRQDLIAERDRLQQAVEVFREGLEVISEGPAQGWVEIARSAMELGDAILKGEDAGKEDGK